MLSRANNNYPVQQQQQLQLQLQQTNVFATPLVVSNPFIIINPSSGIVVRQTEEKSGEEEKAAEGGERWRKTLERRRGRRTKQLMSTGERRLRSG